MAVSEEIGLSLLARFLGLRRCAIPSVILTRIPQMDYQFDDLLG